MGKSGDWPAEVTAFTWNGDLPGPSSQYFKNTQWGYVEYMIHS